MKKAKKVEIVYSIIMIFILILTVSIIWYLNNLIPFMMDDEWYSTLLYSDQKISSISDIIKAEIWHYNNWGGRSITHSILQLILWAGPTVADIINTIMLLTAGLLIVSITSEVSGVKLHFYERVMQLVLVIGAIIGLNANWELSMFWQAGAANYLYITNFILVFIWVYLRELQNDVLQEEKQPFGINYWILPLGLIAGWSNENMGPAVFLFTIMVIAYAKKTKGSIPSWTITGSIFSLIGSVMCIAAPGNFVRVEQAIDNSKGTLWKLFLRGYYESTAVFNYMFVTILLLVIALAIWHCVMNEIIPIEVLLLVVTAVLSWGGMTLSPHYPDRATYGTMVLIILVINIIATRIISVKPAFKILFSSAGWFIWLKGMYVLASFCASSWGWI